MCPPWESIPWPLPTTPHQGPLLSAPTVPVKPPSIYWGLEIIALSFPSTQGWEYDGVVWLRLGIPRWRGSSVTWRDWQPLLAICFISFSLCYLIAKSDFIQSIVLSSSNTTFFSLICSSSQWDISGSVVCDFEKATTKDCLVLQLIPFFFFFVISTHPSFGFL